ncbi:MAG TPA: hypothetical protein VFG21_07935 [Xanthomonadaceae bacterium]|nr:hypothetical protein [Xanthomonadaceae bacterium]
MRTLIALLLTLAMAPAVAGHRPGRLVEVAVVDRETGQTLDPWWHGGRPFVAGVPGHRYALRLSNRSGGRVLAVLSVDGVNAVSGETARADQTGYVLDPWQSIEIDGWRKSLAEIAAFEFTALSGSYAARTGRPDEVGVIGVAVFQERVRPLPQPVPHIGQSRRNRAEAEADAAAPATGTADAKSHERAQAGEPLGTGHGQREWSPARRTAFERATRAPAEVVAIRYDSHANLVAMGVIPRPWQRWPRREPQPFPAGFVPDPR